MIKLHYFNPQTGIGKHNFGDVLVPIIVEWISGQKTEYVEAKTLGKLLCIGSELVGGKALQENDIVWGYGANRHKEIQAPMGAKFLMFRGKNTAKLVKGIKDPGVYGDPALLMPLIYEPKTIKKDYPIGLISHYIDKKRFEHIDNKKILKIDINDDVYKIMDQMNTCEIIISTSLHGCIVAESYGVPVVWLKASTRVVGMEFKWNDYLSGTGRKPQKPIEILNKQISDSDLFKIVKKPLPKPVIKTPPMIKAWRGHFGDIV